MRRRRRQAVTYSSVALLRTAIPRRTRWQRHVPVAAAARRHRACSAIASARPQLTTDVPIQKTSIILALDESGSMCSTDVAPEPAGRRPAGGAPVRQLPAERDPDRSGAVQRVRRARRRADDRSRGAGARHRQPDHRPGHRHRGGDAASRSTPSPRSIPQVKPVANSVLGCHRHSPVRQLGGTTHRAKPGSEGLRPRHRRAADRRGQQPGDHPADRPSPTRSPVGSASTRSASARPTRPRSSARPSSRAASAGGGFGRRRRLRGRRLRRRRLRRGPGSPLVADLPPLQRSRRRPVARATPPGPPRSCPQVFANLPKEVKVQKEHDEVTAEFAIIGALLALAALAASIRWGAHP